jgi:DNA-binding GntR family transcriptional regulator
MQGYSVASLSQRDLADLVQARVEIESLALRLSVEHGDMAWEANAVASHHVLERTTFAESADGVLPSREWVRAHSDFHHALIAGCPNERLLNYATNMREEALFYQMWSIARKREPDRDGAAEHRALLAAAVNRNVGQAYELIRDHLMHTARLVLDLGDEQLLDAIVKSRARSA